MSNTVALIIGVGCGLIITSLFGSHFSGWEVWWMFVVTEFLSRLITVKLTI